MHQFAASYFPSTVTAPNTDFYCKYNDRSLSAYSAIMHFTGALASLPASWFTQHWGRTRWEVTRLRNFGILQLQFPLFSVT